MNALRRLKHLDPDQEGQLQGYLRRSLVNLIRDDYRRAKREPTAVPLDGNAMLKVDAPAGETLAAVADAL